MKTEQEIIKDLVAVLDAMNGETVANQGQVMDGFSALYNFTQIAVQAKHLYEATCKNSGSMPIDHA